MKNTTTNLETTMKTTIREQIENGTYIAFDLIVRAVVLVATLSFVCWVVS